MIGAGRRHPFTRLQLVLSLTALLVGCGGGSGTGEQSAPETAKGPPRLLFLSSMIGYVEPCGCTLDLQLGGIGRIAATIDEARKEGPVAVVVVGPHLFEPHIPEPLVKQQEARARLLTRSLKAIGVDALVPGPADLSRGADFYRGLYAEGALPDVTANVSGEAVQAPAGPRILTLGDLKVGLFGLADPEGGPMPGGAPTDPVAAGQAAVADLKARGAQVIVGLSALPRRPLRKLARSVKGVDLWLLGDHPSESALPSPLKGSYLLEAGDRGRHIGQITLHEAHTPGRLADPVGDQARALKAVRLKIKMASDLYGRTRDNSLVKKVQDLKAEEARIAEADPAAAGKRFEYALVPIEKSVVPRADIAGWKAAYDQELKTINLASAPPPPPVPEGGSKYVGGAECIDCHEEAQQVWLATPHARAWQTLVDTNKTFDAECVSCHVTGWMQPGGVSLADLRDLKNVQCEVCHGPGERHVEVGGDEDSITLKATREMCMTCHNAHHSPKFDFDTYLPKVLGPGHEKFKSYD